MVIGMAAAKITITLQPEQLEEIHALVATKRAASVSGFVQHAVGVALHDAMGWRELLRDALEQTGGPLTKKERQWADRIITAPRRRNGSRRRRAV